MSSSHSQTHDPEKAIGSKVMGAFGLSNICYGLSLLGADMAMVDSQIGRAVGVAGSHVDIPAPSPSLNGLLWLGQWLIYLLGLL